jgi:hypothetical protein
MAHFALIDENNKVTRVMAVENAYEHRGEEFLSVDCNMPGRWIQTSRHTHRGQHYKGKEPLRMNYAGIGFTYDEQRDAFIPPKPFPSWTFNEDECSWDAPTPMPTIDDRDFYRWNEAELKWIKLDTESTTAPLSPTA